MAQPATHQPGSSLQATFEPLAGRWHDETGMLSSPSQITRHPAYQEIIQLGEPVLPFILKDLIERGGLWYPALRRITGVDPVGPGQRGRIDEMKQAWLGWARQHG